MAAVARREPNRRSPWQALTPTTLLWLTLLSPALLAVWPDVVAAQPINPSGQLFVGNGYSLTLTDTNSELMGGRRLVHFNFQRIAAPSSDAELFVELELSSRYNRVTTTKSFTLPAGKTSLSVAMSAPALGPTLGFGFKVYENGVFLDKLTSPAPSVYSYMRPATAQTTPRLLVISSGQLAADATIWFELATSQSVFGQNNYNNAPAAPTMPHVSTAASVTSRGAAPSDWADYSGYDFVAISRDELLAMQKETPATWQALLQWAGTGGNLIIGGCSPDWSGVADVDRSFAFAPTALRPDGLPGAPWSVARLETAGMSIEEFRDPEEGYWGGNSASMMAPEDNVAQSVLESRLAAWLGSNRTAKITDAAEAALIKQFPSLSSASFSPGRPRARRFTFRPFQFGTVIAVTTPNLLCEPSWSEADDLPFTPDEWRWLFADLGAKRCVWDSRTGVTFIGDNKGHAGFRIPGVGRAPVGLFQILITAFALLIGPINFYLLRRANKLHLMLLTVPFCAGIATFGLLGYALIADGFGTQSRVRSITLLDQPLGQATTWSRQAYYAGLTPSTGLTFSPDVVVLPVQDARDTEDTAHPTLYRRLAWTDADQNLASGWLTARKPTQMLTVRARESHASLQFSPAANGVLPVKNGLGVRVLRLYARDAADKWYHGNDIAADGTASLTPIESFAVRDELGREITSQIWETTDEGNAGGFLFRNRYYYNSRKNVLAVDGLMEEKLQGVARYDGTEAKLDPGMYAAVVERSPEVELGLEGVDDHDGFHLIVGRWRAP